MPELQKVHHIAVICSNYEVSKAFYTNVLGLQLLHEHYRAERDSWKADLGLHGTYILELFSFPHPPPRPSRPEACGLRHIAFSVADIVTSKVSLEQKGLKVEDIRIDEYTGRRFTFFADPDGLPIELYEG
ncbi:MAG: VOC family protein [Chitinophagia bacterium]|nr:VOC family protein [Chitinophagia bacterium]